MVRKAAPLKAPDLFGIRTREHMLLLVSDLDLARDYLKAVVKPFTTASTHQHRQRFSAPPPEGAAGVDVLNVK